MSGTPWGAIVQGINETAGGIASSVLSRQASSQAWDRQKKVLKRQIQWRTADLRKAGLNPVLAAGGGVGGGGASVAQSATPNLGSSNIGSTINQEKQVNSKKRVDTKTLDVMDAQAEKAKAETGLANENAANAKTQRGEIEARIRSITANARNAELAQPELLARAAAWGDPDLARIMLMTNPASAAAQLFDRSRKAEANAKSSAANKRAAEARRKFRERFKYGDALPGRPPGRRTSIKELGRNIGPR